MVATSFVAVTQSAGAEVLISLAITISALVASLLSLVRR